MKYHLFAAVVLSAAAFFLPTAAIGADSSPAERQGLGALLAEALERNPELKADEARWEAFVQKTRQAGTLDDPVLMLRAQNLLIRDPTAFDREPMTSKVIGISQKVPFFGKRELQRQSARQDAESARWQLEERKVELARMVKEAWFRLLFMDRALEIVAKNIDVLDDLIRFSETRYGVGEGLQQDVLKAQVERSKMEELRISLAQQRRSLEVALNSFRFRSADLPIRPDTPLELTPLRMDAAELEELAFTNRPLLRGLRADEQGAVAAKELAEKEYFPDFTFSLEYMQREPTMATEGYDMYTAGVTFNLPVFRDRRHARVAEADSEIRLTRAEQDTTRNLIRLGIADTMTRLERSRRLAELYRQGIIPQADSSLAAAAADYRVGRADFMNVLDSQTTLFNLERDYLEAVAEHQKQLAELEAVVGAALPIGNPK
jgi:outer membrane protein TolC